MIPGALAPISTADRVVAFLVLIFAIAVVGASAIVVATYARALKAQPDRGGLLLWHVCGIATGSVVVFSGLIITTLDVLGLIMSPRVLRLSIYLAAGVLYLLSLWLIAKTSRRRVQPHAPTSVVARSEMTTMRLPDTDGHIVRDR